MVFEFAFMRGHCGTCELTVTGVKPVSTMKDGLKSATEGEFTFAIHNKKKSQHLNNLH